MHRFVRSAWVRDAILAIAALGLGTTIGYVDSLPTWDDTGITVSLLLLGAALVAAASGRRPWLWPLLIGVPLPVFEFNGAAGAASLAAVLVAAAGSFAGWGMVRAARAGGG